MAAFSSCIVFLCLSISFWICVSRCLFVSMTCVSRCSISTSWVLVVPWSSSFLMVSGVMLFHCPVEYVSYCC